MIHIIYSGTIKKKWLDQMDNGDEAAQKDFYEIAINEVTQGIKEGKFLFQTPVWSDTPHLINGMVLFSVGIDVSPIDEDEELPGQSK